MQGLDKLKGLDLTGRPFLHEQGNVVLRGFVKSFEITDEYWTMIGGNGELLDKDTYTWVTDGEDSFGGNLDSTYSEIDDDGMIDITCYGSQYYIAVRQDSPWSDTDWPELDGYPGGPMA
ncbi:MAG: hypothetical protein ABJ308_16050 [Halieaceae bacterium]